MMSFFYTNKKLFKKLHTMIYFITIYIYIISKNTNVIKGDKFFFFLIFSNLWLHVCTCFIKFFFWRERTYIYIVILSPTLKRTVNIFGSIDQ